MWQQHPGAVVMGTLFGLAFLWMFVMLAAEIGEKIWDAISGDEN